MGASAVAKKKLEAARFKERGNELAAQQLEQLSQQLETFHANLEEFAAKHKHVGYISVFMYFLFSFNTFILYLYCKVEYFH